MVTRSDKLTILSLSIAVVAFISLLRLHKPLHGEDRYHAMVQQIRGAQEPQVIQAHEIPMVQR